MDIELSKYEVVRGAIKDVAHLRKNIDDAVVAQFPHVIGFTRAFAFAVPMLVAVIAGVLISGIAGSMVIITVAALLLGFRLEICARVRRPHLVLPTVREEVAPFLEQIANHEDSMNSIAKQYEALENQATSMLWTEEQKDLLLFELNAGFATALYHHRKAAVKMMQTPTVSALLESHGLQQTAAAISS